MSVTGLPGTEPTRAGIPVADLAAGLYLAVGMLVALHDRDRTGAGRWVQTSLLESMIAMMDFQAARWTIDHEVPAQEGNHHPTGVPMGCFASADGYVNIAGSSGRLLHSLCEVIGLPGIPADPRFDSAAKRSANRAELNALIAERLRTRTTAAWVEELNRAGVPCGPVYRMDEVFADPQVEHLGDDRAGGAPGPRPAGHPPQRGADDRCAGHRPGAEPGRRRPHRRGARRTGLPARGDRPAPR